MWRKLSTERSGPWWWSTVLVMNGMARCTARRRSGWRGAHGGWRRMSDLIIGIDLGTTNSEVAAFMDGKVRVLGPGDVKTLPSCVGISPAGELLVGESARNQQLVYPDRTVRSIKRRMGSSETVLLGDKSFTPQEISALILRELTERAGRDLNAPVKRAVITVPAYFSDSQPNATRAPD